MIIFLSKLKIVQYLLNFPDRYSGSQFATRATMHIFLPVHLASQRFEPFFHILIPRFLSFLSINHYCKGPGSAPSNKLISEHLGQPWAFASSESEQINFLSEFWLKRSQNLHSSTSFSIVPETFQGPGIKHNRRKAASATGQKNVSCF